jgi:hypothetical protein
MSCKKGQGFSIRNHDKVLRYFLETKDVSTMTQVVYLEMVDQKEENQI